IQAMGMSGRMTDIWQAANTKYLTNQQRASDVAGGLGAVSKVMRTALQSAVLGLGAYLVIEQQATAGIIIASSILTSRALAPLEQWDSEILGRHIGYRPQDVELVSGTVAQNIARFEPEPDSEAVIAAATAANVHELILRLSDGYETQIGEGGTSLSAGQRQR